MIDSVEPSAQRFLVDLSRIRARMEQAQRRISSGLKVAVPSDGPDKVSKILDLLAQIEHNTQIGTNLGLVKAEVDSAEQGLQTAVKALERAVVLASRGAGTMETAQQRLALAEEVSSLEEQMVSLTQTMVQGRYIFSGDRDTTPLYSLNLDNPNGVDELATAAATRRIQHPNGTTFTVARTAQEIFDARNEDGSYADTNVLVALNSLRVALEGNDQAGVEDSLLTLRSASDHLNLQLSFYGTAQNRVDEAIDFANNYEVQLKTALGVERDADLTEAILQLNDAELQHETALAARSSVPKTSLFDYLG